MRIKGIESENFCNYKKPSMFIAFPSCSFKCEKECGKCVCQNSALATSPTHNVSLEAIIDMYINNDITEAIVCGGLEPLDSFSELLDLIIAIREKTDDDIVIYTGYKESECSDYIKTLALWKNIIVKFGRFIPDQEKVFDETLGVYLASPNQYARRIN